MTTWEYKSLLFEFSKDGLLSDRYVDDEEMERQLNRQGHEGWELVNVSLLHDGLLAVFKRPAAEPPLAGLSPNAPRPKEAAQPGPAAERSTPVSPLREGRSPRASVEFLRERREDDAAEDAPRSHRAERRPPRDDDPVGGIRIS